MPMAWLKTTAMVPVLLGALLIDHLAAEERAASQLTDDQVVDNYLNVAFGSETPLLSFSMSTDLTIKRDPAFVVNIVPLPKPSVPMPPIFTLVNKVVADLQGHADAGITLRAIREDNFVAFLGRSPEAMQADLMNSVLVYVGSVEELRVSIQTAAENDPAIWQLYLYWRDLPENAGKPLCVGVFAPREEGSQAVGTAIVWIEYGPALEECLYEEIMQTFGIANDLPAGSPSMFNDDGVYKYPTQLDWQLWRIHSDPRIVSGMGRYEARAMAGEVLRD